MAVDTTLTRSKALARSLVEAARSALRLRRLRATRATITTSILRRDFEALGIATGDTVMVHSSLARIGYLEGGPRSVVDALVETVGPSGTVVIPTYWVPGGTVLETCRIEGYVFDPRTHGSHLGRLSSEFLRYPDIERSIHPTHSVSAFGREARAVTDDHHRAPSIFGDGSPWQRCIALDAKIVGLGISMGPVTFYHALEDEEGAAFPLDVHHPEHFLLPCRDREGNLVRVPIAPFDPALMPRRIDAPARDDLRRWFHDEFVRAGLLVEGRVGEALSWYIPAQAFHRHLGRLMREGVTIYASAADLADHDARHGR